MWLYKQMVVVQVRQQTLGVVGAAAQQEGEGEEVEVHQAMAEVC
jgi:hypothetical protein